MSNPKLPSVTLGGIGGDSHSVGLFLIRLALETSGFTVNFIGIQNTIEEVFQESAESDFTLISCMDGHAINYLQYFPKLQRLYKSKQLWYLGGNPLINPSISNTRKVLNMGFKRVFTKYIEIEQIMYFLKKDFSELDNNRKKEYLPKNESKNLFTLSDSNSETFPRFNQDSFNSIRAEVLDGWSTGHAALSLETNAKFLSIMPNLSSVEKNVQIGKRGTLVQPRTGVPLPSDQLALFKAVISAGADVVSYQVDSYTRNLNYTEISNIVDLNSQLGSPEVNGTPIVNWGVEKIRQINVTLPVPTQVRHSSKDPRLLAEISFGGGCSGFEGGAICYNIPYYKNLSLRESIEKWKYVDFLVAKYNNDYKIKLHREFFGVLTGTLIPPSLAITTGLLESYLAAKQGVKNVSIGFGEAGNLYQDVATVNVIKRLGRNFLDNQGFKDVKISATLSQHMGAFPNSMLKSKAILLGSAMSAKYSKPDRIITKTYAESSNIPSLMDNCESLKIVKEGLDSQSTFYFDKTTLKLEEELIESECIELINNVFSRGNGEIESGIIKSFEFGELDIPFAPSKFNKGRVVTFRDTKGAIRYLDTAGLPIPQKNKQIYKDLLSERLKQEALYPGQEFKLVQKDIRRIIDGEFLHWPLDSMI
jgi:methylaspartate mutase epsilon subunit